MIRKKSLFSQEVRLKKLFRFVLVQRTLPKETKHFSGRHKWVNGLKTKTGFGREAEEMNRANTESAVERPSAPLNIADRVNKPEKKTQIYISTKGLSFLQLHSCFRKLTLNLCLLTYLAVVDISGYRCSVQFRLTDSVLGVVNQPNFPIRFRLFKIDSITNRFSIINDYQFNFHLLTIIDPPFNISQLLYYFTSLLSNTSQHL